jgi:hypothetical protein
MAVLAAAASGGNYSFLTLTHRPVDVDAGEDPEGAPAPEGFAGCDPTTHVMRSRAGVLQWRRLLKCRTCVAYDSGLMVLWRKRIRRRWPNAQVLVVREEHPGEWSLGTIHLHVIVTGLPFVIRPKSRSERLVKEHWYAVGGGHARATVSKRGNAQAVGRYVGKYVTKAVQSSAIARRCRIWRRTSGFAAGMVMVGYRPPVDLVAAGRVDLLTGEILPSDWVLVGWWDDYPGTSS